MNKNNIRVYGDRGEQTELAENICEMAGTDPVMLYVNEDFQEDTAIAMVDANYHEGDYPIIFAGSKYIGGVDELRELFKEKH